MAADFGGGVCCGASFTEAEEIKVKARPNGVVHRCVLFQGMLLTATASGTVGRYDQVDGIRVLPGESFTDSRDGEAHRVHVVDMEGGKKPFMLLVTVREADTRIVTVEKFT